MGEVHHPSRNSSIVHFFTVNLYHISDTLGSGFVVTPREKAITYSAAIFLDTVATPQNCSESGQYSLVPSVLPTKQTSIRTIRRQQKTLRSIRTHADDSTSQDGKQ